MTQEQCNVPTFLEPMTTSLPLSRPLIMVSTTHYRHDLVPFSSGTLVFKVFEDLTNTDVDLSLVTTEGPKP